MKLVQLGTKHWVDAALVYKVWSATGASGQVWQVAVELRPVRPGDAQDRVMLSCVSEALADETAAEIVRRVNEAMDWGDT